MKSNVGFFPGSKNIILIIVFISIIFSGCATIFISQKNMEIRDYLSQAKGLSIQGKYELAVKKNEMILINYETNPWKDKVLFNLGYLYAYFGNPQRNYEKSIVYFQRLITEFPESPYQKRGNFWLSILNEIQLKGEEINRLKKEFESLKKENDDKIEKLKKKISIQRIAMDFLENQIKNIKRIDIQLDKKERKVKKKSSVNHNSIKKQ